MFDLLGSEAGQKKRVLHYAGHMGYPVNQERRKINTWLDTHLGPVMD